MNLIKTLKKNNGITLFTTPSHSQKFSIFAKLKQFYKYDISETDAHNPQQALKNSEKKASEIYKTKATRYLTNGSTSGIIAAALTCLKPNDKVLIWDNAHISHSNAAKLANAQIEYYSLSKDEKWGIYLALQPEHLEKILATNDIKALILTSPSYEGIVCNVKAIKEICQKYNTYLIVDEAHGALYPFSQDLPESAISQGADFVIQSLHKTAGGLNPTALLHNNTDLDIMPAIKLITTTSPSYPLLASIEKNINYLHSTKGKRKISQLIDNIKKLKSEKFNSIEFCDFNDCTKILIRHASLTGEELSGFLYEHKIEDERTNEKSTMLLCGLGTDIKKLNRLKKVLKKL